MDISAEIYFFKKFHKYYFIYWYFIAETVFGTNDVRMTSLEGTQSR